MNTENHNSTQQYTKTMKPLYWSLFGGGGMIAALALPTLIFLLGFALPFGLIGNAEGFYVMMQAWFANKFFFLCMAGILFLVLWHCVHRFYYCLHDCQIHIGGKTRWALYTIALVAFAITLIAGW